MTCPSGSLVVIDPGEVHQAFPEGGSVWEFDTLYLDDEAINGVVMKTSMTTDARLTLSFTRLHHAVVENFEVLDQEELAVDLIHKLVAGDRKIPCLAPSKSVLDRVRLYLDECPESDVSLTDLAALADMSPSHLSRAFRREFGLPPHAYLIQARVERARALLRQATPIIETAARSGFADQAHLTRHFRRLVGVTPGRYRAEGRIVQDRPEVGRYR